MAASPLGVERFDRPKKMTARVADLLRKKIIEKELVQGDFIPPEAALLEELGVSRPTLREALRVLEAEALIVPRRGTRTGAEVRAPSVDLLARYMGYLLQYEDVTLADVHRARLLTETSLARELAKRRDDTVVLDELRAALHDEAAVLDDPVAFSHASVRFHEKVAKLAGIHTMYVAVQQYNWVIERHHAAVMRDRVVSGAHAVAANNTKLSHRSHVGFLKALEAGTPEEVEEYWRSHIEQVGEILLADGAQAACIDLTSDWSTDLDQSSRQGDVLPRAAGNV